MRKYISPLLALASSPSSPCTNSQHVWISLPTERRRHWYKSFSQLLINQQTSQPHQNVEVSWVFLALATVTKQLNFSFQPLKLRKPSNDITAHCKQDYTSLIGEHVQLIWIVCVHVSVYVCVVREKEWERQRERERKILSVNSHNNSHVVAYFIPC